MLHRKLKNAACSALLHVQLELGVAPTPAIGTKMYRPLVPSTARVCMQFETGALSNEDNVFFHSDTGCLGFACAPLPARLLHAAFHASHGLVQCEDVFCMLDSFFQASSGQVMSLSSARMPTVPVSPVSALRQQLTVCCTVEDAAVPSLSMLSMVRMCTELVEALVRCLRFVCACESTC